MPKRIGRPTPVVPAKGIHDGEVQRGRKTVVTPDSRYIGGVERRRVGVGTRLVTVTFAAGYTPHDIQTATFFTLGRVPTSVQVYGVPVPLVPGDHPEPAITPENIASWTPTSVQVSSSTASVTAELLVQ